MQIEIVLQIELTMEAQQQVKWSAQAAIAHYLRSIAQMIRRIRHWPLGSSRRMINKIVSQLKSANTIHCSGSREQVDTSFQKE